jgi:hypothetical protein
MTSSLYYYICYNKQSRILWLYEDVIKGMLSYEICYVE